MKLRTTQFFILFLFKTFTLFTYFQTAQQPGFESLKAAQLFASFAAGISRPGFALKKLCGLKYTLRCSIGILKAHG